MRIEDEVFGRIKQLVIERTLHHYYENKDEQLRDRLHRRLDATGLDPHAYLRLLESSESAEWSNLESEVTINETFFFRFAEQFACLERTILPALLAARASTRRLRVWSAGCSTGAEPYSVAILLHRLLREDLRDWSISILGTDIDEEALRIARAGDYTEWALRSLSPAERQRDFIPLDGDRGRRWSLRPAFRAMVQFRRQNLLDLLRGPPTPNEQGFDLVLCRNVLIYFRADTVQTLVRRFGCALAEDGWLLLGHAEGVGHALDELRAIPLDGTVAWRRTIAPAPLEGSPARASVRPGSQRGPAGPPGRAAGSDRARSALARAATLPPAPPSAPDPPRVAEAAELGQAIDAVRALADRGLPGAALEACRTALHRFPLSADLFFYAALLNRALDRDGDAEADFRRALYLCKSFVMAHYHLGLLLSDGGRPGLARRVIAEAGRIARTMEEDALLPCGDGMTAGRLDALCRQGWLDRPDGA